MVAGRTIAIFLTFRASFRSFAGSGEAIHRAERRMIRIEGVTRRINDGRNMLTPTSC
jgi:hypothetical protein